MLKFLVINDFNDINDARIRHFSLDKGHYMAKSLSKLGNQVYFLTTKENYVRNGINYIFIDNVTAEFVNSMDYVMIVREPLIIDIVKKIPSIKENIGLPSGTRKSPKYIVKSDSPLWFLSKNFVESVTQVFGLGGKNNINQWVIDHIDYICAQNDDYAKLVSKYNLPSRMILVSNMSVVNELTNLDELDNPYDINHSYCVNNPSNLSDGKALWPRYYVDNPHKRNENNVTKYIVVYTGRIKTDSGKIFFNMRNIMNILGEKYELHIFPGSFVIPSENGSATTHSSKNSNSLEKIRDSIFNESKNIIVHYPYEHENKYRYLHYADCGIDFSDTRPKKTKPLAGHAKILEYCESGLPVVCEDNIHNLFLLKNGKNGIILPYMASDEEYANAIEKIVNLQIDRKYCRDVTIKNENWDKRTAELLDQIYHKTNSY
jgi:glycosyltransferase involved in cell wall biosynthesis